MSENSGPNDSTQIGIETGGPKIIPGTDSNGQGGRYDIYNLVGMFGGNFNRPIMMDPEQRTVRTPGTHNRAADENRGMPTGDPGHAVQREFAVNLTPLQMMDNLARWGVENPDALLSLREALYSRGFYGDSKNALNLDPRRTAVGENDFKALGEAMKGYYAYSDAVVNSNGKSPLLSFNQWLSGQAPNGAGPVGPISGGGSGDSTPPPAPTYELATAQALGDQNAQNLLGHSLAGGQAEQLQAALNTDSATRYAEQQNDDPTAFAKQWLVDNNMDEYKQHQATSYMNTFLNLIGGNGTAAHTAVGDVAAH